MPTRNSVRLTTRPTTSRTARRGSDASAATGGGSPGQGVNGAEIAVGVLVFFLIGWGLDSWLGTTPVAMVVATVFGTAGYFVRAYYAYTRTMTSLERERRENELSPGRESRR